MMNARRLLLPLASVALASLAGGSAQARRWHHLRHARAGHARVHHHRRVHHRRRHHARPRPTAPPAAVAPALTPPPSLVPAPVPPPAPTTLSHLQVPEREFTLTLSHATLPAGPVAVEAVNFGEDPHNLAIQRAASGDPAAAFPMLDPGHRVSQTVNLSPGTYRLYCTISGHAALGMQATLTVR
jgi:plastocyanin